LQLCSTAPEKVSLQRKPLNVYKFCIAQMASNETSQTTAALQEIVMVT